MKDTLGVLLAGGAGERLYPLTRDRAKPAVTFGGIYRIIDITLSNCINSDLRRVYILTQYKALSLNRHIREGWGNVVGRELGEFIEVLPPTYQLSLTRFMGGSTSMNSPSSRPTTLPQPSRIWRFNDSALYCVRM